MSDQGLHDTPQPQDWQGGQALTGPDAEESLYARTHAFGVRALTVLRTIEAMPPGVVREAARQHIYTMLADEAKDLRLR